MNAVNVDISYLKRTYFYFDEPVPYKIKEKILYIYPIKLIDSEIFLSSINLLTIDKNSIPDVKIIQMSYLDYIIDVLFDEKESNKQKFVNILKLCLNIDKPFITIENNSKAIFDEISGILINAKDFDIIKKIILYQNLLNYDDSYINPEVKQSMDELDIMKSKDIDFPNLERRIAIISAHSGITKNEQLKMTYRSHVALFNEICDEVDFLTTRPIALYTGQSKKFSHWIFKKFKNKFEDYFVSTQNYNKSMGGEGKIKKVNINSID